MHAGNNCKTTTKQRSELELYSGTIVNVTEYDLKWLLPLADKLSKKNMPLVPNCFTIREKTKSYELFLFVQEEAQGLIRIDGYSPKKFDKIIKVSKEQCEKPFFSITIRFILGRIECENYLGDPSRKDVVWEDVKNRFIPVILYMQQCREFAVISKKKITVKQQGKKSKKMEQTIYDLRRVGNEIPDTYVFLGKKFNVVKPKFEKDIKEISKHGLYVDIRGAKDITWLQKWADKMRQQAIIFSSMKYHDNNRNMDYHQNNKISAIRVYSDSDSFMQIQVQRVDKHIYQLCYFEEYSTDCEMIIYVDISSIPAKYDIAYVFGNGEITTGVVRSAQRLATFFFDCMIYLRNYSWDDALDEDGNYYGVTITKFPDPFKS